MIRVIFAKGYFQQHKINFLYILGGKFERGLESEDIPHHHFLEDGRELHSKLTGSSQVCHDVVGETKTYLRVIKLNKVVEGKISSSNFKK